MAGCCARTASGHAAIPPTNAMNSRRRIAAPRLTTGIVAVKTGGLEGPTHVRFGPKAVIIEIVSGPIYISAMSPSTRYWTLHWLRVLLWPAPVLSLFRAGRWA